MCIWYRSKINIAEIGITKALRLKDVLVVYLFKIEIEELASHLKRPPHRMRTRLPGHGSLACNMVRKLQSKEP